MRTIRVIDLLNKVANGEQPNKIKYQGLIYFKSGMNYVNIDEFIPRIFMQHIFENSLNDEIEILEDKITFTSKTYNLNDFAIKYPDAAKLLTDIAMKVMNK